MKLNHIAISRTREKMMVAVTMLISATLIVFCIKDGHDWGDDFALYIEQARSLIHSSIYSLYNVNKYAMQNSSEQIGPYLYPNGFPFLLTPVYHYFGINFIAMKAFCGMFFILSIPVLYQLFRHYFVNSFYAFCITFCIAVNYLFITYANVIGSDLPFFFFSSLSLLLMTKKNTVPNQIILGAVIYFSYFTRDIGIALIPTLVVYQAQQLFTVKADIKNKLFYIIPYLVFIFLFGLVFILLPHGGENHFEMFFSTFSFAELYQKIIYYLFFFSLSIFINLKFSLPFIIIAIIGMFAAWKQNLHFIVYMAFSLCILFVWPAYQGVRFIFPVIPIFIFFLIKGLLYLWDKFNFNIKYLTITLALSVGIMFLLSVHEIFLYNKLDTNECYTPEMISIYNYISKNTLPAEIIGFVKPRAVRLFTNRNGIYTDQDHFANSVAKYLLITKREYKDTSLTYKKIYETKDYVLVSK